MHTCTLTCNSVQLRQFQTRAMSLSRLGNSASYNEEGVVKGMNFIPDFRLANTRKGSRRMARIFFLRLVKSTHYSSLFE
jgi:hypothetical protein